MKKVFLDNLPLINQKGRKAIDWTKSIGYKCNFIYDDVEDEIEITDYDSATKHIYLKYKDNEFHMYCSSFKACQFGKVVGKINEGFKVEIGTILKDDKRDMIIIDGEIRVKTKRDRKYKEKQKWYKYKCNKCGWKEGWIEESNLLHGNGCACCNKKVIVKGINDIATTDPWMIEYLINKEDAYNYASGSTKKLKMKCPICEFEKSFSPMALKGKGFGCNKCSDGIKYPNKFFMKLLEILNVDFIPEYTPEWIGKKRYDFYIPSKKLIIEMDGGWHFKNNDISGQSKEELKAVDDWKDEQAINHNLRVIRINCDYNCQNERFDYVVNSILSSELSYIFNLENIDWLECDKAGCKSLIKEVCFYKNNNDQAKLNEIANKFNISVDSVIKYMKIGNRNGWCKYIPNRNKNKEGK